MFWTPKWKKEAKLTIKGAKKFISYKRDLLEDEHIKNIQSRQQDVKDAIQAGDMKEVKKKCSLLEQECKRSLSNYVRPSWIAENTEVFFVAIVVALGLRAYYLQPFRIPTGSMQPTLNGINGHAFPKDKWPNFIKRQAERVSHGRSYIDIVAENDVDIEGISEFQSLKFFTKCQIQFSDGSTRTESTSKSALLSLIEPNKTSFKKGEVIAQGFVDTGDLVLVDKFSYHFRKPQRGETFVFDTRNIEEIHQGLEGIKDKDGKTVKIILKEQQGGSHYIKRCIGTPGDTISINEAGQLIINGKVANDKGIEYAMKLTYNRDGHQGYVHGSSSAPNTPKVYNHIIDGPSKQLTLKGADHLQLSEYAAFGDNTANSLDSRYWGTVKQYNLVGPALITLWPFTHEIDPHWGIIK